MNIIACESRNSWFLSKLREGMEIKQSYLLEYLALLFCVIIAQGVQWSKEVFAASVIQSVVPDTEIKILKSEVVEKEAFSLKIPLWIIASESIPKEARRYVK